MRERSRIKWHLVVLEAGVLMLGGWWFAAHAADTPQPPTPVPEEKGMTTDPAPGSVQERAVQQGELLELQGTTRPAVKVPVSPGVVTPIAPTAPAPTTGGTGGTSSVVGGGAVGSWSHAHGDAANRGFADVVTAPGSLPARKVMGIGSYAAGAGPVIAADGTVYLGNTQGQLRAFTPTGDQKWMRDTPGRKIVASPVVGADGSIYVVGTSVARDHRDGVTYWRFFANLYKFHPGGAMLWVRPFPERSRGAGATSASPNIWRWGGTEVIIVPVLYQMGGYQLTLVAFSTDGAPLFEQKVTGWADTITASGAGWGDFGLNAIFGLKETVLAPEPNQLPYEALPPMPSVGIFAGTGGGPPVIVVADNYQNLVGYNFSPIQGFQEIFRKHLTRDSIRMSSPALLRDGHSVIHGNWLKQAWTLFGGPNSVNWTEVPVPLTGSRRTETTPTITADGRIVMVDRDRRITVIGTSPNRSVLNRVQLGAESIAPAAASCSHVFVSTASAFVTLDAKATGVVVQFDWLGGGLSPPAISPNGSVYALAGNSLHIFPPPPPAQPRLGAIGAIGGTTSCQGGGLLVSP